MMNASTVSGHPTMGRSILGLAGGFILTFVPSPGPTVDAGPAINKALAANPNGVQLAGKGAVYKISTAIVYTFTGQKIAGAGRGKLTEVRCDTASAVTAFIQSTNLYGTVLTALTVTVTANIAAGGTIDAVQVSGSGTAIEINYLVPAPLNSMMIYQVDIVGSFNCVHLTDAGAVGNFNVHIEDSVLQPCNGGSGYWPDVPNGGIHTLNDVLINDFVPFATTNALAAVRLTRAGDVTLRNVSTFQTLHSILVDTPNGGLINTLTVIGGFYDTPINNCIYAVTTGTGKCSRATFTAVWFAGASINGLGPGPKAGHNVYLGNGIFDWTFDACKSYDAHAGNGDFVCDTGSSFVMHVGCTAGGGGGGYAAIGTADHIYYLSCKVNNGSFGAVTPNGVTYAATATNTFEDDCDFSAATTARGGTATTTYGTTDVAWFKNTLTLIQNQVKTLTDVTIMSEMGNLKPLFDLNSAAGTGTITNDISALAFQTGATAASTVAMVPASTEKCIPNLRTNKYALAVRCTKIAVNNTCDLRLASVGDNATGNYQIGILGATSQVNYTTRVNLVIVNLGVAQSAAGTYDTLVIVADGINYTPYVNGVAFATQAQVGAPNAAGLLQPFASNGATGGNCGFKIDKLMLVQEAAV
jgi:hypothetical protein